MIVVVVVVVFATVLRRGSVGNDDRCVLDPAPDIAVFLGGVSFDVAPEKRSWNAANAERPAPTRR